MTALTLKVKTCPNRDFGERSAPGPSLTVAVADFAEASNAFRTHVHHHGLGGGNIASADLTRGGKKVAHVSYNGRVWPVGEWQPEMKPLFDPS